MRKLIRANPQSFLKWMLPKAAFKQQLPDKLGDIQLEVDALILAEMDGEDMLVNIEIQTYHDPTMAERLLRYNVFIRTEYRLPVLSCVIHLLDDQELPKSPLTWSVPHGQEVLQFHYESAELAYLAPEDILQTGLVGLYPLLTLTRGGTRRNIVEKMFSEIGETGKTDLEVVGFTLASFAFTRLAEEEQDWLIRRFHKMHDILRDTPIYQLILKEGREEGREEGLEQGKLEVLRQTLVTIMEIRFPKLVRLAKKETSVIDDPDLLKALVVKMSIARDAVEAKQFLLELNEDENEVVP